MMKRLSRVWVCVVFAAAGCESSSVDRAEQAGPMLLIDGDARVLTMPGKGPGQRLYMRVGDIYVCPGDGCGDPGIAAGVSGTLPPNTPRPCECTKPACMPYCKMAKSLKLFDSASPSAPSDAPKTGPL